MFSFPKFFTEGLSAFQIAALIKPKDVDNGQRQLMKKLHFIAICRLTANIVHAPVQTIKRYILKQWLMQRNLNDSTEAEKFFLKLGQRQRNPFPEI